MKEIKPPKKLTIRFCPVCGHDDMIYAFKAKHYAGGQLCAGVPVTLTYRLDSAAAPQKG